MSYPITTPSVTRMVTGLRMAILRGLRCVLEEFKNEQLRITDFR